MRHEAAYAATPTDAREDLPDACECRRTTSTTEEQPIRPSFAFLAEVADVAIDRHRGGVPDRDFVCHATLARFGADGQRRTPAVQVIDREHAQLTTPKSGVECEQHQGVVTLAIPPLSGGAEHSFDVAWLEWPPDVMRHLRSTYFREQTAAAILSDPRTCEPRGECLEAHARGPTSERRDLPAECHVVIDHVRIDVPQYRVVFVAPEPLDEVREMHRVELARAF